MVQGTINGYGERCGNANLVSIIPTLTLKMGYTCRRRPSASRELTGPQPLRRRDGQPAARPWAPVRRPQRLRPQGRHARQQGVNADARDLRAHRPGAVGNERRVLVSELSGRGTILAKARELGMDVDDGPAARAGDPRRA